MRRSFEKLLQAWKRQREMTTAPESLVAGKDCVMMAEVDALITRGEALPPERATHADNCPYCQRTIRLFEETRQQNQTGERWSNRPLAWLFSTAGLVAAGICLFIITAPGSLLGPSVPRMEPIAGRARGFADTGVPIPASVHWRRDRTLIVSWNPVPNAAGYRVILYPDGEEGVPWDVTDGAAKSLAIPWNEVPRTERIVYELRAIVNSP